MALGFTNQRNNNKNKMKFFLFFLLLCFVLQRLSTPNLSLFFDLVGSNYSKVVFLSSISLQRHQHHPLPFPLPRPSLKHTPLLSRTVPFHPSDYDIQSSRLKQQVCQRITFLWSQRQLAVFLSWARALTPDLQWLLPWLSQAEITVNAGLWYPFEKRRSSLKGNAVTIRHLSMCTHTQIDRQCTIWQRSEKHGYDFLIKQPFFFSNVLCKMKLSHYFIIWFNFNICMSW